MPFVPRQAKLIAAQALAVDTTGIINRHTTQSMMEPTPIHSQEKALLAAEIRIITSHHTR